MRGKEYFREDERMGYRREESVSRRVTLTSQGGLGPELLGAGGVAGQAPAGYWRW